MSIVALSDDVAAINSTIFWAIPGLFIRIYSNGYCYINSHVVHHVTRSTKIMMSNLVGYSGLLTYVNFARQSTWIDSVHHSSIYASYVGPKSDVDRMSAINTLIEQLVFDRLY
jgi:hypothetical protein